MRKLCLLFLFFLGFTVAGLAQETSCSDGLDNDGNGFIDCFDGSCAGNPVCDGTYTGNDPNCQVPQPPGSDFSMTLENETNEHVASTHGRFVIGDMGDPVNGKDGIPEVVTAHTSDKAIYILDGQTLDIKYQNTSPNRIDRYDIAIADVQKNGCAQIFVAEVATERVCTSYRSNGSCREYDYVTKHYVSSWDCEAKFLWRTETYARPFTLALADFDSDGMPELYFRNQILDAATGAVHIPGSGDWAEIDGGPVAVDILADGECADCEGLELVAGGQIYSVGLNAPGSIDGGTLTLVRSFKDIPSLADADEWHTKFLDLDNDEFVNSQTSIADFDLDGYLDVLMTGTSNSGKSTVFYWNVQKNQADVYRPANNWKYGAGRLNLADLDGDGQMNVAFVSGNYLYALDENLDLLWRRGIDEQSSGYTSTTVFDFNNDGASEIVYRDETYLYIVKGDGTFSPGIPCKSLTSNDYPIVADVDADGSTEICVICQDNFGESNYAGANDGVIRTYTSANEPWVSSRKVWNQHGYFNVNVNDDLTIPIVQQKHHVVFSVDQCGTGENRVLNSFLNQSAILNSDGCKTYPSADIAFAANPAFLNITPPACPSQDFQVSFSLRNIGDLDITANVPITFYSGDPQNAGAVKLRTEIIALSNFKVGDQLVVPDMVVTGTGGAFTLYAVLNDNGSTVPTPIALPNSGIEECNLINNIASASIDPQAFQLTTSSTDHIQCGAGPSPPNGSVKAFKPEGAVEQTVGYTFYWFNGTTAGASGSADHTGPEVTGLTNGTYTVYAMHDAYQCGSDTVQVTVGQQALAISASVNVDKPYTNCNDPDGQLSVIPNGGAPDDYTYEWFEGTVFGTSPTLSDSSVLRFTQALTYSVLLTQKSSGCETLESGTVPDQTITPTVTTAFTAANCAPANSGQALANVGGVTAGYTFYWYDGSTSKPTEDFLGHTYSNVTAGNYTVIAKDNSTGCNSNETVVTVGTVSGITVSTIITTQQTSCAMPNGAASANVGGTTAGFSFRWFDGNNTTSEIGTSAAISGLAAGNYTVEATNVATGCTDTELITIVDNISIPTVSPSVTANQVDCFPPDGSVSASAAGSPGPYIYYWFDGNIGTPDTTSADFKGANYTSVVAGFYTVVAVDANTRCASARGVVEVLDQTVNPVITVTTIGNSSCDVASPNGQASADVGGVTMGYKFRWFTGSDTTAFIVQSPTVINRAAGTYTVKGINLATGCFTTKLVVINDISATPTLKLAKLDNSICSAGIGFTGSVTSSFLTNPHVQPGHKFVYAWTRNGIVMVGETGPTITGIDAGTYEVAVENEVLGCISDPVGIVVNDVVQLPALSTTSTASTNCVAGLEDGTASVVTVDGTAVGSTSDYTYQWHSGSGTGTPIALGANPTADDPLLTDLQGGAGFDYTVLVTNTLTGCVNTAVVNVSDGKVLPELSMTATDNAICDPALTSPSVEFNGTVTATVDNMVGGLTDYTFVFGGGAGSPGASPNHNVFNELDGGITYTATATHTPTGCVSTPASVQVLNVQDIPDLTTSSDGSTNCVAGLEDGQARVVTVDGAAASTTGFTFAWTGPIAPAFSVAGNTTNDDVQLEALQGGAGYDYTVLVTNLSNGCQNTAVVNVADAKILPELSLVATDNSICDPTLTSPAVEFNGTVTATVDNMVGGLADYTFAFGGGAGTPGMSPNHNVFNELDGGITYTATSTHTLTGCVSTPASIQVLNAQDVPDLTTSSDGSTNCVVGLEDGQARVVTVDGAAATTTGFTFAWTGPIAPAFSVAGNATNDDIQLEELQGGAGYDYSVLVTNLSNGCRNTALVNVADAKILPELSLIATDNSVCDPTLTSPSVEFNGTVTATVDNIVGGLADYTFAFGGGAGTPGVSPNHNVFNELNGGISYTATATHTTTGCISSPANIQVLNVLDIPDLTTGSDASTNCAAGLEDGQARVMTVDGAAATTTGFTFAWTGAIFDVSGLPTNDDIQLEEVQGGAGQNYTVVVTNESNGCQNTAIVNVADERVLPAITLTPIENTICDPALTSPATPYNGNVTATVDNLLGALTDYSFVFGGGAGTQGASPVHNTFTQLNGDITYTATATHTPTGCISNVATAFVTNNLTYPALLTSADASTNCVPAQVNGAAHVTGVDGFVPGTDPEALADYAYQWYNGNTVIAGNLRPGDTNPTVGSTTPGLGLQGGAASIFSVLVTTNANGCQSNTAVTIPDAKADPVISVSLVQNNTICDPLIGADGSLTAAVTYKGVAQGTPLNANWVVTWSTTDTGEGLTGLTAGNYSAFVTDTNTGCVSTSDGGTVVDQFDIPVITTAVLNNQTSCDLTDPNGQLQGSATNGPVGSTLRFRWFSGIGTGGGLVIQSAGQASGANLQTLAELATNDYTFEARNEVTGCTNTATILLPQQLTYPAFTGAVTDVTSCVPTNGQVDIALTTISDPNQFTIYYLDEVNFAQTGDPAVIKAAPTYTSSNTPADLTYRGVIAGQGLIPGTYTVLVRDEVTQCESNPETFTVDDNTNKTVTVSATVEASACNSGFGGEIHITVAPVGVYTYEWYEDTPTNNNFDFMNNTNLPTFAGGLLQSTVDLTGYTPGDVAGVGDGIYTVVVRDAVGCGKVYSETVPFLNAPGIVVTPTNSTQCDPLASDARVQVEVTGVAGLVYSVALYSGHSSTTGTWVNGEDDGCIDLADNDGDGVADNGGDSDCGTASVNTVFTNTSALLTGSPSVPLLGDYLVRVYDPAGSGCAIEKVITLEIDPKLPQVTTAITPSTVCAGGTGDGTVEITVSKDPLDPTTPIYELTVITPASLGGGVPQPLVDGTPEMVNGTFNAQSYVLTVTDNVSGCTVDKTVNVPSQPAIPTAFVVTPTHDELCAPSTGGSAAVTTLTGPGVLADYNFEWYRENTLTTLVTPVSAGGAGGELLTSAEVIAHNAAFWPVNPTNGLGNGNKTFYVRAQKQGGVGDACYTPIVQVNINDTHSAPDLNLTPFSNTSCTATPEGRIEITATTTSTNGAIAGSLYTYTWTPVTPGTPDNNVNGAVPYLIPALDDNTYTVTALNEVNGCIVQNSTTVQDTKFDIEITDRLVTDQDICPIGGQIDVTEIEIDRTITGEPTLTYNGVTLSSEFNYQWFKAPVGSPGSFDNTTPLEDNAATDIDVLSLVAGTAASEYPSMGHGTYYVIATRTNSATLPGAGCASQPLRVDVADRRVFPTISFATLGSTACNNEYDGQITVNAASTGFGAGTLYNFDWTSDPGGAVQVTDQMGVVTGAVFQSESLGGIAGERIGPGAYNITVTNTVNQCAANGSVNLQQNTIPVEVVSATATALTHCTVPDGTVAVATVNVDGAGAALGDFSFGWTGPGGPYAGANVNALSNGDYFVTATKTAITAPASGCATSPFKVTVLDERRYPTISFATLGSTACNNEYDGQITVTATSTGFGVGTLYNFDWTNSPAGTVITDRPGVVSAPVFQSEALGGAAGERIGPGAYDITVTNTVNACFTDGTLSLQQNTIPVEVASATATALTHCTVPDGTVAVATVNVDGAGAALGDFTFGWTGPGGPYAGVNVNALSNGDYFVTATKTAITAPASGCATSPFKVTVLDERRYPAISFTTLGSTACNNEYDGQITVTATSTGFGVGTLYNFDWTNSPAGTVITDRPGVVSAPVFQSEALGGAAGERIGPGAYDITVTNTVNACFTDGTLSLQQNTIPVEVASATATALTHCTVPDGTVAVATVNVDGAGAALGDFTFGWTGPGGPYAGVNVNALSNGDYFVTATKTAITAPASGCATSPFKVTVLDERRYPAISFATLGSTACNNEYDGQITVTAISTGFGAGTLYNFDWTTNPAGTTITDRLGIPSAPVFQSEALGGAVGERIGPGAYDITVTNTVNACFTDGTVSLQQNTVPVEILTASATPQQMCTVPGDGSVSVALADVRVGGNPVLGGITFAWEDNAGIPAGAGTSVTNLTTGFYIVQATRTSGLAPASGCVSAPTQVEVADEREYPEITFSTVANTTCDNNFDAQITLMASTEGIGAGANYDLVWTGNPGGAVVIADAPNVASPYVTSGTDNIGVGTYTVTATNVLTQCPSNGSVTVLQNTTPVQIWEVSKIDQRDCAPFDGSITIDTNDPAHVSVLGPYTFAWEKAGVPLAPVPDNILSAVDAGVYTVVGTKASGTGAGCVTNPFTITLLDLTQRPTLELSSEANFACDPALANGELAAVIFEGASTASAADFTLQWFAGRNNTTGPVIGNTDVLSNQTEGDYTLLAVDNVSPNRGCDNTATLAIDFDKTSFTVAVDQTHQNLCAPLQNGSVTVTGITEVRNGVTTPSANFGLFDFQWFEEDGTAHASTPTFVNGANSIANVLSGDYTVQVRNALGCVSTATSGLVDDLTIHPVISLDNFMNPTICILPEAPGSLQVSADNSLNFSDYIFEWFEGSDDTGPLVEPNNATLSNILYSQPLEYTVRVTNIATNCINLDTYRFGVDTVDVKVLASAVGRTNCLVDDGNLFATTLNGAGALYSYEWYSGPQATGTPIYTTKEVAGAPMGQYTVIAINPNHAFCTSDPYTTRVTDARVYPDVATEQRNPLTYCDPANPNGVAFASVGGGVIGYTFDWFQGSVGGSPIFTGPEVKGLAATTYVVRATDVLTGCEQTASIAIENDPVNVPEPAVVVVSHHTNCVVPDGILSVSVGGNVANYFFQWYDGNGVKSAPDGTGEFYRDLEEGNYTATATDNESGCVSDPVVAEVLPFREDPEFDVATVPTNCEQDIGEASIVMLNEVQLSSIEWDINGVSGLGARLSELPKGEFTVLVTSFLQCTASKTFTIEPEVLVFNGVSRNNDGQNDIFEIACIQDFPQNNVKIFNRAGTMVYEANGYDNQDVFFDGVSNRGINLLGTDLPDGTYFYIIDKRNGSKPRTGYLELLR